MRRPESEADVLAAASKGEIAESPSLDVKRDLDSSNNRETAKDLASFAIDGGALLIGLDEDRQSRHFTPSPIALEGVAEKLEQIAQNRIDPPLPIRVYDISVGGDPTRGFIWVEIPASDAAPHMVGGIYYARGDRTTRRLSDAEVVRLHRARATDVDVAVRALNEMENSDPDPFGPNNDHGRLNVVAQPLSGSPALAEDLVWEGGAVVERIVTGAALPAAMQFAPSPTRGGPTSVHPAGQVLTSHNYAGTERKPEPRYHYEVLFQMDGGIRALCGRMTDQWQRYTGQDSIEVIFETAAVGYSLLVSKWAADLAARTGYNGAWALGVHATGLQGRISNRVFDDSRFLSGAPQYRETNFRETIRASTRDLTEEPETVAYRLTRRLLRTLQTEQHYRQVLGLTS